MRVVFLLVLLLWTPLAAGAQDAPESPQASSSVRDSAASSDSILREALSAYEAGELARAEQLLSQVHAQEPSARTLRGLGFVAYRLGRYPEAVSFLQRSLVHPIKPLTPELEAGVRELLFDAGKRVGKVELAVTPVDAQVRVDGSEALRDALGTLILAPGPHEITLSARGRESVRLGISISSGSAQSMNVTLRQQPAAVVDSQAPPRPDLTVEKRAEVPSTPMARMATPSTRPRRMKRTSYTLMAITGAALLTAGGAALTAQAKLKRIEDYCRDRPGNQCEVDQSAAKERAANLPMLGKLVTVSLLSACATGLAGGALYLTAWRAEGRKRSLAYSVGFTSEF